MNCKELEITNVMITCDKKTDKHKETLSAYGIKGKEKTSSTQEKKKKARDGYVRMYECRKYLFHSMYQRECTAQETTIHKTKEIVDMYNYEIK